MRRGFAILLFLCASGTRAQIITTIAGDHVMGFGGIGGPAVKAQMGMLYGIATDKSGNVFAADQSNNVIWKVDPAGTITLFAGTGLQGYSGDGGAATQALLYAPAWLAMDPRGDLYFTDQQGIYIREVNSVGVITTVAGNPAKHFSGGDGGLLAGATFNSIRGLFCDAAGNLYISDNNTIRIVNVAGIISTIAGTGQSGYSGDGGPAILAQLNEPYGVGVDKAGNIYVPDANNNVVRKINTLGVITTIAGMQQSAGYNGDGGPATDAKLAFPWALTVDSSGNVFIDDEGNWEIRKVDAGGTITDYGGDHQIGYSGDGGPATEASISYPTALACDAAGNLYLTDVFNYVVREIKPCMAAPGTSRPAVAIATAELTVCSGVPISFTASAKDEGASPSFQWKVNGIDAGVDSMGFTTDSLHDGDSITCLMTAVGSCQAAVVSNVLAMVVHASPAVSVTPEDTAISYGQSVNLGSVTTGFIATYQWTPAAGLSYPNGGDPVATPRETTVYRLTVRTNEGCTASDSVKVEVYRKLAMPNSFTPNGDGKNDVFRIPQGVSVELESFEVFDRAGVRVFFTSNASQGWDGTIDGVAQPVGMYVWIMKYKDVLTGKRAMANGTIMLVR